MREEITPRSKARLKRFLTFLNTDIGSLPRRDFLILLIDLSELQNPHIPPEPPGDSPDKRKEIEGYRNYLKEMLDSILERKSDGPVELTPMQHRIDRAGGRIFLAPAKRKDALLIEFISCLEPFLLADIRRCEREDCRKYFLRATKKEKHYCSNNCAWIVASRGKRAEAKKEAEAKAKEWGVSFEEAMKRIASETRGKRKGGKR